MPPSGAAIKALSQLQNQISKDLPEYEVKGLLVQAEKRVKEIASRGSIFDENAEASVVKFDRGGMLCFVSAFCFPVEIYAILIYVSFYVVIELEIGGQLGVGGYCTVSEVTAINVPSDTVDPPLHSREYMSMQCIRQEGGPRYAIKQLSPKTRADNDSFLKGIADIVVEARLLAVIQHQNVIKIRGFATGGYFDKDFFIVMDRLHATLDKKISQWSNDTRKGGFLRAFSKKSKDVAADIADEKITTAIGIARAMDFVHSKK